jgi:hypothetical protein
MKINTTSYLAGVGSVVAVLSTGFAGGYFLANPTHVNPPNRLQRLAAEDHTAPAAAKPEAVAAETPAPVAAPVTPGAAPAAAATPIVQQPTVQQAAAPPTVSPAETKAPDEAKAPEPARTIAAQETIAPAADKPDAEKANMQKASIDKARADEPKLAERKRSDARKVAEQQRKQRELEVATVAVRRIIHGRDAPDIVIRDRDADVVVENDPAEAPAPQMPHFNLFGQ